MKWTSVRWASAVRGRLDGRRILQGCDSVGTIDPNGSVSWCHRRASADGYGRGRWRSRLFPQALAPMQPTLSVATQCCHVHALQRLPTFSFMHLKRETRVGIERHQSFLLRCRRSENRLDPCPFFYPGKVFTTGFQRDFLLESRSSAQGSIRLRDFVARFKFLQVNIFLYLVELLKMLSFK